MIAIRLYANTKTELDIATLRLQRLLNKKEAIYTNYFPLTPKIDTVKIQNTNFNKDKMADYVHEITKINKDTGKSLEQEIAEVQNEVNILKYYINLMEDNLAKLKGIEYKLFHSIVVKGKGITEAVEYIAGIEDKDVRTIWRYYPKVEKDIKKLEVL